jgi:hypothetical protein
MPPNREALAWKSDSVMMLSLGMIFSHKYPTENVNNWEHDLRMISLLQGLFILWSHLLKLESSFGGSWKYTLFSFFNSYFVARVLDEALFN